MCCSGLEVKAFLFNAYGAEFCERKSSSFGEKITKNQKETIKLDKVDFPTLKDAFQISKKHITTVF